MVNKAKRDDDEKGSSGKRVPDVIAEHKDWVVGAWLQRTKAHPELSIVKLSDEEERVTFLICSMRQWRVRVNIPSSWMSGRGPQRHGTLRYHQRFSISMLILEAQILQEVVAECIRDHVNVIDIKKLMPDITKVSGTIRPS